MRRCQELSGQELFQYVDEDGDVRDVTSDDVLDYLREASGGDCTAKDFRTGPLRCSRTAPRALNRGGPRRCPRSGASFRAMRLTAERLGNTPAVARNGFVHPAVLDAYLDGSLGGALVDVAEEQDMPPNKADRSEEVAVVRLLGAIAGRSGERDDRAPADGGLLVGQGQPGSGVVAMLLAELGAVDGLVDLVPGIAEAGGCRRYSRPCPPRLSLPSERRSLLLARSRPR